MIKSKYNGSQIDCKVKGEAIVLLAEFISVCRGLAADIDEEILIEAVKEAYKGEREDCKDITTMVYRLVERYMTGGSENAKA